LSENVQILHQNKLNFYVENVQILGEHFSDIFRLDHFIRDKKLFLYKIVRSKVIKLVGEWINGYKSGYSQQ
jgi:hypothetical protein